MSDQGSFTDAVAAIFVAVVRDSALRRDDVATVRGHLARMLAPAEGALVEEAVGDALERFVVAVRAGRVRTDTAGAYLRQIARNRLIDLQRRRRERPSPRVAVTVADSDDAVARLLDAESDADRVTRALAAAVAAGDDETVRIVVVWLDEADRRQARPSARDVAAVAAVSHTHVLRALGDFARYLREIDG